MQLASQYRDNDHFLITVCSSRHKTMVGGTLTRVSTLCVGLGVSGVTIVSGSYTLPSHSWISRLLTSSLSLDISRLFCRATQCMWGMRTGLIYRFIRKKSGLLVSDRYSPEHSGPLVSSSSVQTSCLRRDQILDLLFFIPFPPSVYETFGSLRFNV